MGPYINNGWIGFSFTSECMLGTEHGNILSMAGSCTQCWARTRVLVTRVRSNQMTRDPSWLAANIRPCYNSAPSRGNLRELRRQISETDERWFIDSCRWVVGHCLLLPCCPSWLRCCCWQCSGCAGGELQTGQWTRGGRGVPLLNILRKWHFICPPPAPLHSASGRWVRKWWLLCNMQQDVTTCTICLERKPIKWHALFVIGQTGLYLNAIIRPRAENERKKWGMPRKGQRAKMFPANANCV